MPARFVLLATLVVCGGSLFAQFGDDNYLEGTTQPTVGNVQQGATEHHCITFAIVRFSSLGDTFTGLTIRNTGTATAADYDQLELWWDANDNDVFEPQGPDTKIGSATSGAFPVSFQPFTTTQSIPGLSVFNYFVTVDVSAGATIGNTFLFEITAADVTMTTFPVQVFSTQPVGTTQTITAGAAGGSDQIVVTQDPAGAQPNTAFTTQPQVELRDSTGALLSGDNTTVVTAAITAGTGTSGAVLGPAGSLTATASGGVVDFTGLMIDLAGAGYTLTFTATNFADGTSGQFDVGTISPPTQLFITTQPANATTNQPFATHPVIEIRDASNQLVPNASHFVTVTLNGGTGTLQGTLIVQAVNGVATFNNLFIDTPGSGYTLTFSAVNLASDTSTPFDVTDPGSSSGGGGGGGDDGGGGCSSHTGGSAVLLMGLLAVAVSLRRRRIARE